MPTTAFTPSENGKRQRPEVLQDYETTSTTKRARASQAIQGIETEMTTESFSRKRDHSYYFEDGSCIFLVGDTLFNVHRSIISKDASSFSNMFALPLGSKEAEGGSDDNPICLSGDTESEFRNFLWALYALPLELSVAISPEADISQLVDVAKVANKYSFKSTETWALNALLDHINRKPAPVVIPSQNGSTANFYVASHSTAAIPALQCPVQLAKLIRLAQTCNHQKLLDNLVDHLRRFMSQSVQYAYLAMLLSDELDIRPLRGLAYFEVMQKASTLRRSKPDGTQDHENLSDSAALKEGEVDDRGRLVVTPAQQLRLLSGYYRLTSSWEQLRSSPPTFEHALSCGATWHQHGCMQSWLEFWKERSRTDAVLGLGLADVVGRLKQVQKEFEKWGSAPYMHHDCRNLARRSIQEAIKRVEDSLPDFFSEDIDF